MRKEIKNQKLWNELIQANFEKGFELIDNTYSGKNYWRKGHTSLSAINWGCEGAGIDKEECYSSKEEVLKVIENELEEQIEYFLSDADNWNLSDSESDYIKEVIQALNTSPSQKLGQ